VDKPPGLTSHDAVERLRKVPGFRKTGHAGTLDPMATGLLTVCVNEGTKIARFLMEGDKEYVATVRLGLVTDTQDVTGRVLGEGDWRGVTRAALDEALRAFVGEITQVPPMYSALKREGVRLHVLARAEMDVERAPRRVRVDAIDVGAFAPPEVTLRIACAKGTSFTPLAADSRRRVRRCSPRSGARAGPARSTTAPARHPARRRRHPAAARPSGKRSRLRQWRRKAPPGRAGRCPTPGGSRRTAGGDRPGRLAALARVGSARRLRLRPLF
jgi:tRNA pseudouridine(55) synthase